MDLRQSSFSLAGAADLLSKMKLPSLQFYPADWKKDPGIQALNYEERGIWFEILMLMHESENRGRLLINGKPPSNERLAQILHLDNQTLTTTLTSILDLGVASLCPETGSLMSRRMIRDTQLIEMRRKFGSLGGNPNLVNQKSTTQVKQKPTTGVNQSPTPSSSSSSSIYKEGVDQIDQSTIKASEDAQRILKCGSNKTIQATQSRPLGYEWCRRFKLKFGVDYQWTPKDDKGARTIEGWRDCDVVDVMTVADKSWDKPREYPFNRCLTLYDFACVFNEVKIKLGNHTSSKMPSASDAMGL